MRSGTFTIEDDDGGGGTNSRITASLPGTGLYIILANSVFPNQFGGYTLSLAGGAPCTYSISPTSAEVPASGGTYMFTVTTQSHCQWTAAPHYNYINTNSSGIGSGTVTFTVSPNPTNFERFGSLGVGGQTFNIHQAGRSCQFSLTPTSVNVSAAETTGTFSVIAEEGCFWSMQINAPWVNATPTGSGTSNGFVTYTVGHNNGAARVGTINISGQIFTINQAGLNCTYDISPNSIKAPTQGMTGTINIVTQPNCSWSASRTDSWITIQTTSGSGSGTIPFTINPHSNFFTRRGAIVVYTTLPSTMIGVEQYGIYNNHRFDFFGDGKTDLTVFRPSSGNWYIQTSENQYQTVNWGIASDIIVPADYTGDGKSDIAVWRPSNGVWYIQNYFGSPKFVQFGINGDIPVPSDYDGDGFHDLAVYRPSTGVWYILNTSNSQTVAIQFGLAEDVPTIGDFDGDGKADIAVWRPSTGVWYRLNSSDNSFYAFQFGLSEDKPVAADFDGDGKTDISVFRPSTGVWYRINSSNNSFYAEQFGLTEDLPVAADYDGDGKADIAVWRPSTSIWYIQQSTAGFTAKYFGLSEDKPAQNCIYQIAFGRK